MQRREGRDGERGGGAAAGGGGGGEGRVIFVYACAMQSPVLPTSILCYVRYCLQAYSAMSSTA
eukprot:3865949-Rhodomonas_salina.4